MADLTFTAPLTGAKFMKSNAYGRIIAGPVGSGKTTCCVIELFRRASLQAPAPDGMRYTRFAVLRQTLKQLKDTILKDCEQWIGPLGGQWRVSESIFHVKLDDIYSEWVFIPLEDAEDQARVLSMQLTGAWLSEAIEMDIGIIGPISGRIGRYPSANRGTPTWYGIIADTNMPTEMTPWHKFMTDIEAQQMPEWQLFRQPSGLSPYAENLNYLLQNDASLKLPIDHPARLAQGRRYYERFVEQFGEHSDWVKRYVNAEYGDDPSGAAVFKNTFRSDFHIKPSTEVVRGYPLIIGQDFGRNPWSLICQPDHMGRLLVHEEVPGVNVGLEKHINENLRPRLLSDKYLGCRIAVVGDPAGVSKDSIAEESCIEAIKRLGLPAFPAPTNDIDPRLRAVDALLVRQSNGGPALVISAEGCPFLCRAMSGGYRYAKSKEGILKPKPDKENGTEWLGQKIAFSHVADCLQYVSLVVHGSMMEYIAQELYPRPSIKRPPITAAGWT